MKKKLQYTLALFLMLSLVLACGSEKPKPKKKKKPKIEKKEEVATKEKAADEEEAPPSDPTPPEHIEKAKEIIASIDMDKVAAVDAKKKFKTLCAICHGFTGDLQVNGAKNLKKSKISLEESVAQVYFGKGLMTPFKGIMKDEEIVAVAKYVETMRR